MSENKHLDSEFSFKNYFIPLTTVKAIHWIIVIGLIVFVNLLFNGFVWDDFSYIVANPEIHSFNLVKILSHSTFNDASYYRPLPALYFTLLYSLFSFVPFPYHILQIMLHIFNTVLLFFLFTHFFKKKLALFLSLIFLVHPIQIESVALIAQTVSPLFFLFGITAVLLSLKDKISNIRIFLIFSMLLLSFLTKETGLLFLLVILIYKITIQKKHAKIFLIYGLVTSSIYFFIRFVIGGIFFAKMDIFVLIASLPLSQRIINIPAIIFYYLKTFFFPVNLAFDQQWIVAGYTFTDFYFPLFVDILFFIACILIGIYLYRSNKKAFYTFFMFFIWFIMGLFMVIQIFPLNMTVAERWFYFPIVGILGMIGVLIQLIRHTNEKLKRLAYIIAALLVILFSIRTIIRNTNWQDNLTLYTHDSRVLDNYDIENSLGEVYYTANNLSESRKHLQKSVDLFPNGLNLSNLGVTYEYMNNMPKAKEYYIKAIDSYNQNHPSVGTYSVPGYLLSAYYGLSGVLYYLGDTNSAEKIVREGLYYSPDAGNLWTMLALTEYKLHNRKEALRAIGIAKTLMPSENTKYIYTQILNNQSLKLDWPNGSTVFIRNK